MDVPVADTELHAWVSLLQAHAALVDAVEGDLERERGIPLSWYEVLVRLETAENGALRMQELARGALLSKSGLTRLVDRMEVAGLLERRTCDSDRRGVHAAITEEGRTTLASAAPVFFRSLAEHFARHLSEEEVGAFVATLHKVIRANGVQPLTDCHSTYAEGTAAERDGRMSQRV
jgi:DNA-binding MarR family transcriptional regulator